MTASNITTQDLLTIDHVKLEESPDTYQQNWVSQWMVVLQACDADDFKSIKKIQDDLQLLGQAEQTQIWQSNDHLKTPLEQMMLASKDTSEITSLFSQLYDCIERIKPPTRGFFSRFKSMFLLLFSWEKDAMALWLESYPRQRQSIDQMTTKLKRHERQLGLDNVKLNSEYDAFVAQLQKLTQAHDLIERLQARLLNDSNVPSESRLIQSEFVPWINHRFLDIQQQLLMGRQTAMTLELLIQHNENQAKAISQVLGSVYKVIEITARIALVQNKQQALTSQQSLGAKIDEAQVKSARALVAEALAVVEKVADEGANSRIQKNIDSD
ncbi:MAG: toxic anion resistance protein [Marinicella sp.]|nr:toxic anion resistance protein [Xanthomonadales bacterium]